jgi:hypothetical protein
MRRRILLPMVLAMLAALAGADEPRPTATRPATTTGREDDGRRRLAQLVGRGVEWHETDQYRVAHRGTPDLARRVAETADGLGKAVSILAVAVDAGAGEHARGAARTERETRPARLGIALLPEWEAFARLRARYDLSEHAAGFYLADERIVVLVDLTTHPEIRAAAAAIAAAPPERQEAGRRLLADRVAALDRTVWQHELGHQALEAVGLVTPDKPGWFVEGLAQACETWTPERPDLLANVNARLVADFRARYPRPDDLPDLAAYVTAPPGDVVDRDYAVAWALLHYLWHRQPPSLVGFVAASRPAGGVTPAAERATFARLYGPPDRALAVVLHAHVLGLAVPEAGE